MKIPLPEKFKSKIKKILKIDDYLIEENYKDMDENFFCLYHKCVNYTMTGIESLFSLYQIVNYVLKNNVPGDFVECGVWKGGCSMVMGYMLEENKINDRRIYMYDTFEGMTEAGENDIDLNGNFAKMLMEKSKKTDIKNTIWCYSPIEEVKSNLSKTNYELLEFIKGRVEDTIPGKVPEKISILRLDTDFYESTYHELKYLYPLLQKGGILLIDDYGHWKGARKVVDKYFSEMNINPLLNRINYSLRVFIKQ